MTKFKPFFEDKCWGRVQHVFAAPQAAVSCLDVRHGWRCSRHRHKARVNLFAVNTGIICVEEWTRGVDRTPDYHFLAEGDVHVVPTWVYHRFRVLQSGSLVEVYYPDDPDDAVRLDDIDRLDEGGADDVPELQQLYAEYHL